MCQAVQSLFSHWGLWSMCSDQRSLDYSKLKQRLWESPKLLVWHQQASLRTQHTHINQSIFYLFHSFLFFPGLVWDLTAWELHCKSEVTGTPPLLHFHKLSCLSNAIHKIKFIIIIRSPPIKKQLFASAENYNPRIKSEKSNFPMLWRGLAIHSLSWRHLLDSFNYLTT